MTEQLSVHATSISQFSLSVIPNSWKHGHQPISISGDRENSWSCNLSTWHWVDRWHHEPTSFFLYEFIKMLKTVHLDDKKVYCRHHQSAWFGNPNFIPVSFQSKSSISVSLEKSGESWPLKLGRTSVLNELWHLTAMWPWSSLLMPVLSIKCERCPYHHRHHQSYDHQYHH